MPLPSIRRPRLALVVAACILSPAPALAQQAAPAADAAERWYRTSMGDTPVGWLHERTTVQPDGRARTDAASKLVINRLGRSATLAVTSVLEEDAAGRLGCATSELVLSAEPTHVEATVERDSVRVVQRVGERRFARALPYTGELLGPEGVRRRTVAALRAVGDSVVYQIYSPELNAVTAVVRRAVARESIGDPGARLLALRVDERMAAAPVPSTLWLDAEGRVRQVASPSPLGAMTTARAPRELALAAAGGAELSGDLFARSMARTGVRIPRARELDALTVELRHRAPALGWPRLSTERQRVTDSTAERVVLRIERPAAPVGATIPVAATPALAPYLAANAWIQSDDTAAVALAHRIVGDERDAVRAAFRLQRWVREQMRFDAGIVFAPSGEVLRDRRGTCIGYATVLATLARAVGLPARVAMGYAYVDGVFAGHAWTEVLAGDAWIPIDAALPGDGVADAARITLVRTALADGATELGASGLATLFGQIDARVLDWSRGGERVTLASADAGAAAVRGDTFEERGLGFALHRPAGFAITATDSVYPSPVMVALVAPDGRRVVVERRGRAGWQPADSVARAFVAAAVPAGREVARTLDGRPATARVGAAAAAAAVVLGTDVLLLRATGPDAGALLDAVAASLRWIAPGRS